MLVRACAVLCCRGVFFVGAVARKFTFFLYVCDQLVNAQQEEEFITNRLTKRLDDLKHEKEAIIKQVEAEEEHLTNTLQKRLRTVSPQITPHKPNNDILLAH